MGATIGIDYRPALSRMTGVGRYVSGLLEALSQLDHPHRFVALSSSWKDRLTPPELGDRVHWVDRRVPVSLLNRAWHRWEWPSIDLLCGEEFDIAHSPTPMLIPTKSARRIVTIHDLFFLSHPEQTAGEIRTDYAPLVRAHAERADLVVTVSHATAKTIEEQLSIRKEKVEVIHNGIDPHFLAAAAEPTEDEMETDDPHRDDFILVTATLEPRKNVPRFVEAIAHLQAKGFRGRVLLVGGDGPDTPVVEEKIARYGLSGMVRRLGYVEPQELIPLYRRARLFVLPSIWEGFGLPLLEAMACGTPVVASDIPAHREVAADAAEFAPHDDAHALSMAIERIWNDPIKRRELVTRGRVRARVFSWKKSAQAMLDVYTRLHDEKT